MNSTKVLFIATSHDKTAGTNEETGAWLEELAAPYYIFKEAGADIKIASPAGGRVPLDPKSQSIILATFTTKRFLKDEEAVNFLSNSMLLEKVRDGDFDVIFLSGGNGIISDLANSRTVTQLLEGFYSKNKPIGATSQGVACLLSLKNNKGEALIKGKQITGISNSEENLYGLQDETPFLLESKLLSLGALYSKGEDYISHVVTDGDIITGQNPASSKGVAQTIIELVKRDKFIDKLLHPASN